MFDIECERDASPLWAMHRAILCLLTPFAFLALAVDSPAAERRPNVIFILADDLGWGDLGCYGQEIIRTPSIDRLAGEGMRFTRAYAGSAVCAPSRCALLTGRHMGHAAVRDNLERGKGLEGQQPMPRETVTVAQLLQKAGYRTGIIGKWGLGMPEDQSGPNDFGFDYSYGYLCQRQAHTFYPAHLWRNGAKETLSGNTGERMATGQTYAHDLMADDALRWVRENRDQPFFLYLAFTIPHYALQVPEDSLAEYRGKIPEHENPGPHNYAPQPTPRAAYAAMVTRMDRDIGRLMALLKELGIDDNTLVVFSSDNGPTFLQHAALADFFRSAGDLRGLKGDLYEGGIRTPLIARWPGKIAAGATSDLACAFWDVMPTLCELTGAELPGSIDGISFLPTLLGRGEQRKHANLYWEIHQGGGQQAVRIGNWKAVRTGMKKQPEPAIELFNLTSDPGEEKDVAAENPEIVEKARAVMDSRTRSHVAKWNFERQMKEPPK